ncbi:hypothetical protein FVEN_g1574 [Fusarium venenatum]|uniref:Uncharacterized protein n=1 Tax=Fusarium venenatum TaxID=56646 RepID=A0A2L2TG30_9HYPO|nr:uncharacterized protein FVRRES_13203 [Fusarium venenatum]KAG8360715.1 hypothetical protein FVEN_g1574 [Fusarium venenatum]KAH6979763.1 hypothetical protein EDB82DRAFT_478467 [Fusarium venenatum]CEI40633.1 unnamed protein product [Fusarium venenatum]
MEGIETTQAVVAMDFSDPDIEPCTESTEHATPTKTDEPSASPAPESSASSPTTEADDKQDTISKIIEVKKTRPTLHVRENLSYWKCNQTLQDGSTCSSYNVMEFKQCKDCKSRRGVGDDGTDAYGTKVAKIVHVDNKNGDEYWQYLMEE